jgi:hypothetical protein
MNSVASWKKVMGAFRPGAACPSSNIGAGALTAGAAGSSVTVPNPGGSMRRLAALAVFCAVLAAVACSVPPPKEYDYPAWGFRISLRTPPKVTEEAASASMPHNLLVEADAAGRDFVVSAGEMAGSTKNLDDLAHAAPPLIAQKLGGEIGPMTYTATAEGVVGREIAITKDGHPAATLRLFLSNGRFYEVAAQSVLGADDPEVKDFLDSFHITAAAPATAG